MLCLIMHSYSWKKLTMETFFKQNVGDASHSNVYGEKLFSDLFKQKSLIFFFAFYEII